MARDVDLQLPSNTRPEDLIPALNHKMRVVEDVIRELFGLSGEISLKNDLNLNGFRLKNVGQGELGTDVMPKSQVEANVNAAVLFERLTLADLDEEGDVLESKAPTAVRSLSLVWGAKKKGWKSTWQAPSGYTPSQIEYDVVYMNSAETQFMVANTGQVASPNTEAGATIRITDTHHTTHLSTEEIAGAFTAGVKVRVRPVVTISGVKVRGPASTSSVIAVGGDVVATDTAVAVIPGAPTLIAGPGTIKVKCVPPTSNFNQFVNNAIVAEVRNGGGATLGYLKDLSPGVANSATEFKNDIGPDMNHTFDWSKDAVLALHPTAATILFSNYITNGFGESAESAQATLTVSTWSADPVLEDTGAPGNLPTPTMKYKRGNLLCRLNTESVTNIVTLKKVELCVTDGVSKSLNIGDLDSETAAAVNTFYPIELDCKFPIPISRDQIRTIFGSGNSIFCTFKLTNDYLGGSTTTSANSIAKSTDTLEDYSSRGAPGGGNELWNGDFNFDDGTAGGAGVDLGNWEQFNINDTSASAWSQITMTSTKTRWTPSSQLVFFRENDASGGKRYIVQNLWQTMIRNDYHSFTWFLSANSSLSANFDLFLAALFNLTGTVQSVGTNIITGTGTAFTTELKVGSEVSINGAPYTVSQIDSDTQFRTSTTVAAAGPGLTVRAAVPQSDVISIPSRSYGTTDTYLEATVQINSDAFTDKNIYLCFRTSTTITTAGPFLQIRRVMMSRGQTPIQFDRKLLPERNSDPTGTDGSGNPIATENLSVVPTTTIGGQFQDPSGEVPGKGGHQIPV